MTKSLLAICLIAGISTFSNSCKKDDSSGSSTSTSTTSTTSTATTSTTATTASTATTSTTAPATSIVASWNKDLQGVPVSLEFKADLSYVVSSMGSSFETGTYTSTATSVTLNASTGKCTDKQGTYSYSITGNTITFTAVTDSCSSRLASVPGNWTK